MTISIPKTILLMYSISLTIDFTLIQQGIAIQASAKGKNIQAFAALIIEGDYYEVYGFYTFENKYTNSVVAHEAVIDLKSDTKVTKIDPMTPPIPRHHFKFIDFAHLLTTGRRSGVLTGFITSLCSSYVLLFYCISFHHLRFFFALDVLGRLKAIQPLEQIMVRGKDMTDKREFTIENIRFVILIT